MVALCKISQFNCQWSPPAWPRSSIPLCRVAVQQLRTMYFLSTFTPTKWFGLVWHSGVRRRDVYGRLRISSPREKIGPRPDADADSTTRTSIWSVRLHYGIVSLLLRPPTSHGITTHPSIPPRRMYYCFRLLAEWNDAQHKSGTYFQALT